MKGSWVYFRSAGSTDGGFVLKDSVRISPNDRGFTLADGVYEVIRSYGGRLFRPRDHLERLRHSLEAVRIDLADVGALQLTAEEVLRRNGLEHDDATVYAEITRGACPRMAMIPPELLQPTLYIEANRLAAHPEEMEQGVAVITVPDIRWQRCDVKALGLLPNVLARMQAGEAGANEAVFVRNGIVTEGTHTNVFGTLHGTVLTHPADNHILAGITRAVVLELCRSLGLQVSETAIRESQLPELDELLLAATTAEVTPVVRVNGRPVADGRPGPATLRLQVAFRNYVEAVLTDQSQHDS